MSYRTRIAAVFVFVASLSVAVGWPASAEAKTTIQGGNLGSQTWTTANDPYVLQGDVTVGSGNTLTIESGVEVQVESSDYLQTGRDTNLVEILIEGELDINGTAASPVHIHGSSSSAGSWYGLVFDDGATAIAVDHTKIEHANDAITDETTGSNVTVKHLEAANNSQAGYQLNDGDSTLENLDLHDNRTGLRIGTGAAGTIESTLVRNNTDHGIFADCSQASSTQTTIDGATIWKNGSDGLYFGCSSYGSNRTLRLVNSIVAGNSQDGVDKRRPSSNYGSVDIQYTDVWNNGDNFDDVTGGTGTFSSNPLVVSDQNPRLTENSPARNAGRNDGDIGALPYNGDPTPKLLGYLWTDTTWKAADSPYTVEGDLTVPSGVTLTVEAGVEVRVDSNDEMKAGDSTSKVEIDVEGTLTSDGTAMDPVEFVGRSSSAGSWHELAVVSDGTADIRQTTVKHAGTGLRLDTNNTVSIARSTFRDNARAGALVERGRPAFDGVLFAANQTGIRVASGGAEIVNAIVRENADHGLFVDCSQSSTESVAIHSTTIHANGSDGLYFGCSSYGSNKTVELVNGIVTNNAQDGIDKRRPSSNYGTVEVRHTNVWGNGDDYDDVTGGTGTISSRPLFKNPPADLHLQKMSFCVDAGTSTDAPNHDYDGRNRPVDGDGNNGAEYDMGAFEYGASVQCGDGAVGPGEVCDDGSDNGTYGHCNGSCDGLAAHCGDGNVDGPEETCDDGADNGKSGHCDAECSGRVPRCGNGEVEGDEVCDDGAMNGTYGHCKRDCSGDGPRCGDGTVDEPEDCDDGNASNTDACLNNCTEATCGDGYVHEGDEECDDGNTTGGDGCSSMCTGDGGGGDAGMDDAGGGTDPGPDTGGSPDAGADAGGGDRDIGADGDVAVGSDAGSGETGTGGTDGAGSEGCGCRATEGAPSGGTLAALLFVGLVWGWRRRRRRK